MSQRIQLAYAPLVGLIVGAIWAFSARELPAPSLPSVATPTTGEKASAAPASSANDESEQLPHDLDSQQCEFSPLEASPREASSRRVSAVLVEVDAQGLRSYLVANSKGELACLPPFESIGEWTWAIVSREQVGRSLCLLERRSLSTATSKVQLAARVGETTFFHEGDEYPVPVGSGPDSVDIEYRRLGTVLEVTPLSSTAESVELDIRLRLCQATEWTKLKGWLLNDAPLRVPRIQATECKVDVKLRRGEAIVFLAEVPSPPRAMFDWSPEPPNTYLVVFAPNFD